MVALSPVKNISNHLWTLPLPGFFSLHPFPQIPSIRFVQIPVCNPIYPFFVHRARNLFPRPMFTWTARVRLLFFPILTGDAGPLAFGVFCVYCAFQAPPPSPPRDLVFRTTIASVPPQCNCLTFWFCTFSPPPPSTPGYR